MKYLLALLLCNFCLKARLTFLRLSQGGGEHRGPFPGLLLRAEVKGDAVVWGHRQSQLVALRCFHLIAHRPQVKLCNCLRGRGIYKEVKLWFDTQRRCLSVKHLYLLNWFLQIIKKKKSVEKISPPPLLILSSLQFKGIVLQILLLLKGTWRHFSYNWNYKQNKRFKLDSNKFDHLMNF